MLEHYFISARTRRWLQLGPLGPQMEALAQRFYDRGYTCFSARELLRNAAHWSRYAMWLGKRDVSDMTPDLARQFLEEHLPACSCERLNAGKFQRAGAAVGHVVTYLTEAGYLDCPAHAPAPHDAMATLLVRYDAYLDDVCGLSVKTRSVHRHRALHLMHWLREQHGTLELSALTAQDILAYQRLCEDEGYSFDWKKALTGCLRGFLRFLRWEQILTADLTSIVYPVIHWKLSTIPRYMPFEDVKRLLAMPNRQSAVGKRDLAMLTLMSLLGLRAGEVVNLCLEDIDWNQGQLRITATKTRRDRVVPLIPEVATVLAEYLQHGRPPGPSQAIFLRTHAPMGPITKASSLYTMVKKYLTLAGITSSSRGTHQLRHSLATHLINHGVTLKEIADLLGHTSIESTGIYAKVQTSRLRDVALPFPGHEIGGRV